MLTDSMSCMCHLQVLFVAIDCWYLHGTCRQDISVPVYPRVVVYFSSNMGFLEYIGGLRSYEIVNNFQYFFNSI